ncbi:unnamed protein product [Rotaria sordida]|uniref:Mono(ADP-ribosyl)transferase n=1 Tax=Rotaria sordida TaxID=392033 RepID=A0A815X830_9BILA|nr:unnamed protein product [Rotaria sordida]CAF1554147.1 unnamed protein product [Rotaria sordida]
MSDHGLLQNFNCYCSSDGAADNGALMRLAPVPLFFYRHPIIAVEYSGISARITHGDRKAYDACRYYGALIIAALHGETKDSLLNVQSSSATSKNVDEPAHTHRFSDIASEPRRMLSPIQGYENKPLVSLEEVIRPLISLVPDVEQMVWIALENCKNPKDGLTTDESASIMLYTMEWQPYEKSFYVILNAALRAANREYLKPWFSYLRLIIHALQKLPSTHHVVYRGVKSDFSTEYSRGSKVIWWGFSSCTVSIETLNNERFLGKEGARTFFSIECESGKNIRSHSYYAEEDEVLLLPARYFEVIGCLNQDNGLHIIQLRETQPKFPLIKFNTS